MSADPRIDVWVCARPQAPHLDAVLAALMAAGAEPRVAVSPAGQGPAFARNEALAACEGEILVLVDDDVEVTRGWLDALRAAWSSPEAAGLGCVGGPLAAVFSGERPAWLGDALLPALGVDLGPPPEGAAGILVPVDAEKRTFHSGNLTFRATALRGVSGFWPARGSPGLRDWFGEEHLAQRELARAGWGAAWLHDAHAARRIAHADLHPLEVVRLRARQGARWGAVGPPTSRATAIRAAATAMAGMAVAAAGRDAAKTVERAARVAYNAGVLAAPALAHRSLQPTATRTRFSFSVPPAAPGPLRAAAPRLMRRVRHAGRDRPLVLLYHRVAEHGDDPLALMVSPAHFAQQLEVLMTRRTPVALEEIVDHDSPESAFAVTVDDGYADIVDPALAEIEAAGIPMTVFVSSGHVGTAKAFWWDALARALRVAPADAGPLDLILDGEVRTWPARDRAERDAVFRWVAAWLHAEPPEAIDGALRTIEEWAHAGDLLAPAPEDRPMTVDELRRLAASPLVTVESHGRGHACLATLPAERRAADLAGARDDISGWIGRSPDGLAYPFGVAGVDVDDATREAAREAGYSYAVLNGSGRWNDRMAIPRTAVPNVGADAFDAWLSKLARDGLN